MEFGWINVFGTIIVVTMLIPNIIYGIKNKSVENKYKNIPSNNELYKYIAKKNNCDNYLRVGWNIDKAIKTMYKLTDSKTINEFFTYNISPSTKNFLNSLVDKFYTININKGLDI